MMYLIINLVGQGYWSGSGWDNFENATLYPEKTNDIPPNGGWIEYDKDTSEKSYVIFNTEEQGFWYDGEWLDIDEATSFSNKLEKLPKGGEWVEYQMIPQVVGFKDGTWKIVDCPPHGPDENSRFGAILPKNAFFALNVEQE